MIPPKLISFRHRLIRFLVYVWDFERVMMGIALYWAFMAVTEGKKEIIILQMTNALVCVNLSFTMRLLRKVDDLSLTMWMREKRAFNDRSAP